MEYWRNFEWERLAGDAISTLVIIVCAMLIWLVLSRSLRALENKAKVSPAFLLPLKLVIRYGVILIALLLVLSSFGIAIGNFWTFVSTVVGLVAIGFVAVWSVLSNISSTFFLLLIQPFKVGEYVRLVGDDVMGRVVDINFMFTTVLKGNGDVFKVPNNQFFQKSILRPADPQKLEEDSKPSRDPAKDSLDHSMGNLEGIEFPDSPKGAR